MPAISNAPKHLAKIFSHKRHVAKYCFAAGLYKQGLTHDLSKFSPTEFFESIQYYQGTSSPVEAAKADKGYSIAWQHHKGRNRHHYEYWQDDFDHGGRPLQMPFRFALECVCDYLGAGEAYMGSNFSYQAEYDWWIAKKSAPLAMHPHTLRFVDEMLFEIANSNSLAPLRKDAAKKRYDRIAREIEQEIE